MKKLTLIVTQAGRQDMLKGLRALGVVHIENIIKPLSGNFNDVLDELAHANQAISTLAQYRVEKPVQAISWTEAEAQEKVKEVVALSKELSVANQDFDLTKARIEHFKPWGAFDPKDITELSKKGVYINLYTLNKNELKQIAGRADINIISQQDLYSYVVQFSKNPYDKLAFKKTPLPEEDFKRVHSRYRMLQQKIAEIDGILSANTGALTHLKEHVKDLEKRKKFLDVKYGMGVEKGFSYLKGFLPENKGTELARLADAHNAGYIIEEPDKMGEVPTFIKNPRWIEIIKPVFSFMNTVPGYTEYDISLWFLLFFSLFFAMLIGDAGYGALFFVTTFIVRRKFKKAPSQPFFLMYALSFTTILWGAITGTWFGSERLAQLPLLNSFIIQDISSFAGNNQNLMIFICFTIGVIQLSIAHFILGFRYLNSLKALAELGWISLLWGLYFLAGMLVIARPFPDFAAYLLIGGIGLVLLFSNPQKNILKGIGTSLTSVPLKIISSFGDVVSYIRLFAVGYASVVLASTFNNMAVSIGFNSIITGFGAAVILFLGHGLNIILGFMAVIVHGVRLNMLEFSGQMGMEWSGKEYAPFKE
jgi:V/A-type H+-transporting ATPase subunit I